MRREIKEMWNAAIYEIKGNKRRIDLNRHLVFSSERLLCFSTIYTKENIGGAAYIYIYKKEGNL